MKKLVLGCVCVLIALASFTCASPSMLGATSSPCTPEELLRFERLPPAARAHTKEDSHEGAALRVAVFNIRSGFGPSNDRTKAAVEARLSRIASALATLGPVDVVGLNEVDFRSRRTGFVDQAAFIADQLHARGLDYHVVRGPAWLRDTPGREIRYGNALLVRHPVLRARQCRFSQLAECGASATVNDLPHASLAAPWSWLSHEPRGVVFADFRWQGREVRAIVTHLDPFSAQVRETQAAQVVAGLVPAEGSVVLLGDMNSVPTPLTVERQWFAADRTHDVLTAGRLFDLRGELAGEDPSEWGHWATYPGDEPRWGLDAVFATADLTTSGLEVFGSGLSDHLGLLGTLLPVNDAGQLSARQKRHALRHERRFERLRRCDAPKRESATFYSWLRDFSVKADAEQLAAIPGTPAPAADASERAGLAATVEGAVAR